MFQDAEHSALENDEGDWDDQVGDDKPEDNQSETEPIEEEGFGDDEAESVDSSDDSDEGNEPH